MAIFKDFIVGFVSVLKTTSSPLLYRYPYRNSAEAFTKDWHNIGLDIQSVIGKLEDSEHE